MRRDRGPFSARREKLLDGIPGGCGVYIFRNITGSIIYIGKAVNLRRRVMQYFPPADRIPEELKDSLARYIEKVDWIPCETELHALLLEDELIKTYRPPYNSKLKKCLSYSYIGIRNGTYPDLVLLAQDEVEDFRPDGRIYGPFQDRFVGIRVLDLVRKYLLLRGCSGRLPSVSCMRWDLGVCMAPCTGKIPVGTYAEAIRRAEGFLSGEDSSLLAVISDHMFRLGNEGDYEQAARTRDQLFFAENLLMKIHFYREFRNGWFLLHSRGRWQGTFLFSRGELVLYSREMLDEDACRVRIPEATPSSSLPDPILYDRSVIVSSWSRSDGGNRTFRFLEARSA